MVLLTSINLVEIYHQNILNPKSFCIFVLEVFFSSIRNRIANHVSPSPCDWTRKISFEKTEKNLISSSSVQRTSYSLLRNFVSPFVKLEKSMFHLVVAVLNLHSILCLPPALKSVHFIVGFKYLSSSVGR